MTIPSVVDRGVLDRLLAEAKASPRRRKHHSFHSSESHPCQRMLNALLPDTYVRPHRHLDPNKEEMLVILRGRLGILFMDEMGKVTRKVLLEAGGSEIAVHIPAGCFHGAVALDPCVVFEAKAGPYAPHLQNEWAPFAPAESSPEAPAYLAKLKELFAG